MFLLGKVQFVNLFLVSPPVYLRLLWWVWWIILTMRMKRKKMRRKSNLQESGPVLALKANCPLFGCDGWTQSSSHLPSSGCLIGPWPSCATCQSHWRDGQRRAPISPTPSWSLLFPPSVDGDRESLFYWKDSFFFEPVDFTSSFLTNHLL